MRFFGVRLRQLYSASVSSRTCLFFLVPVILPSTRPVRVRHLRAHDLATRAPATHPVSPPQTGLADAVGTFLCFMCLRSCGERLAAETLAAASLRKRRGQSCSPRKKGWHVWPQSRIEVPARSSFPRRDPQPLWRTLVRAGCWRRFHGPETAPLP